jgi:hypothetical protein
MSGPRNDAARTSRRTTHTRFLRGHAASPAQAGVVEQSLTRANAKVQAAVLHVRRSLGRKARSTRRTGLRLDPPICNGHSIKKATLRWATQTFWEFGRSPGGLYPVTAEENMRDELD